MQTVEPRQAGYITRSLVSPFSGYAAGFCIALSVYSLEYSDLYPPLQQSLVWFLVVTSAICVGLAFTVGNVVDSCVRRREPARVHIFIAAILMCTFAVEIVANGGVPLIIGLTDLSFNYQEFGVPELHVAFVAFCYFYAVYWFDLYLLENRALFLALSIMATSTSLLMFSRGAFIITLLALVFAYIYRKGISHRLLQSFAVMIVVITWGFGVLGDVRTHGTSGESIILSIGRASDRFVTSNIPTEFFWPYLYISSPLANLQLNMTDRNSLDSPATYFALEFLPDFASKRIVSEDTRLASSPLLITDELAVSTMYGRSFFLMGWLGLLLSYSYFIVVTTLCLRILRGSKYLVAASAILGSLAFLNIFDTMYIFAGGILQVFVALLLHVFEPPASTPVCE